MRQKKSKTLFYVMAIIVIAVLGYVLTKDIQIQVEHVEEVLENNFTND